MKKFKRKGYHGYYTAINKVYIGINKCMEEDGCKPHPMEHWREMVYVHDDGKVYSMVFELNRDKKGKFVRDNSRRGMFRSTPKLWDSEFSEWYGFKKVRDRQNG